MDHYLNIGLLELWSIVVCQIHIENRESDVWFGWYSQWLARLANIQTAIWFGFQRTYYADKLGCPCNSSPIISMMNALEMIVLYANELKKTPYSF